MNKPWDKEGKYKEGLLKEYNHWQIDISFRQHTLGCYIVFAKRDVEKISQLHNKELEELTLVLKEIEIALSKHPEFKPDRFNYLQLGNGLHRLHFHGIPRYKEVRNFAGKKWVDSSWGHPPVWSQNEAPEDLVIHVREELKSYFI